MPIREYICDYCGHQFDEIVYSKDPELYKTAECRCGSYAKLLPATIGGVNGVSLSGARPKNSGAKPSAKAFTKQPEEQLELPFPEKKN
jgi:putative FmdB family regulatory protein